MPTTCRGGEGRYKSVEQSIIYIMNSPLFVTHAAVIHLPKPA